MTTYRLIFCYFRLVEKAALKKTINKVSLISLEFTLVSTFLLFEATRCISYQGRIGLKLLILSVELLVIVVQIDALRFVVLQSLSIHSLIFTSFRVRTNQDKDCFQMEVKHYQTVAHPEAIIAITYNCDSILAVEAIYSS